MSPTTITTLLGVAAAAVTSWSLGGRDGAGVLAGFLAGASCAGLVLLVQRRVARSRPAFVIHGVLLGFLFKAFALLALTAAVRFVPVLAAAADWFGFALAFGAATLLILAPATAETLRLIQPERGLAGAPSKGQVA